MSKRQPKKKTPTAAQKKKARQVERLTNLVSSAKKQRKENRGLLGDLRKDPSLAEDLKVLMCEDLVRVSLIPRDILGPSAARDRYRQLGHYSDSLAVFIFGLWAEFKRQAGLAETLATRTVARNISKTVRAQDLATYADEHVKPWDGAYPKLNMGKKRVRLLVGGDFHSHYCNPFALRVFQDTNKMLKPDGVRLNGDIVDFPQLSTHRQFPGHFPLTIQEEINWAKSKLFAPLRKNNPKTDIKFIIGNHDVRLITAMADKGQMFASLDSMSFADNFKLDKYEIGLVCRANFLNPSARHKKSDIAQNWETLCAPDGRPLWTTVHGFLCGKDAPRKHLAKFMTHGTNAHLHDRQLISGGSLSTGVLHWFQTPCMAHPEAVAAGYLQGPVEAHGWSCGFLIVDIYPETGYVSGQFVEVGPDIATIPGTDKVWRITQAERDQIQSMLEI